MKAARRLLQRLITIRKQECAAPFISKVIQFLRMWNNISRIIISICEMPRASNIVVGMFSLATNVIKEAFVSNI